MPLPNYNVFITHQCNKYFVEKNVPKNRDLNSKQKNCDSHFFQNRAAPNYLIVNI